MNIKRNCTEERKQVYCEVGLFHEHKENLGFKPNVLQMRVPQKL